MIRRFGAIIVVLLVSGACVRPQPEPVGLDLLRTDFIEEYPTADLRVGSEDSGRRLEPWQFGKGWSRPRSSGRWAFGEIAEVRVLDLKGARHFWIECQPYHALLEQQRVEVSIDGQSAGAFDLEGKGFGWYGVDLPQSTPGSVRAITLHFHSRRSPKDAGRGRDRRPLALKARRLALTQSAQSPAQGEPAASVVRIGDGLQVMGEGRLLVNVWSDSVLEGVTFIPGLAPGESLSVALRDPGRGQELDRKKVAYSTLAEAVALDAGGVDGLLQLVIDGEGGGFEISNLRGLSLPQDGRPEPGAEERSNEIAPRPDVCVFVLDAARADHCGATYGYHRDTTPRLDVLAREALVFRKVFSQAPYTTCSVSTMFTGVAFGSHGVIQGRNRLSEQETTLAEALRDAGYRTIGVTATLNNSERLGMAQGFDQFEQLWVGADWMKSIDPMFAAERTEEILSGFSDDGPVFLMVHLVPPHAPYTPPEAYRLWSEADYDGPCDGTDDYLRRIRDHRPDVSQADLNELIALYDGNLRFSDAAVERILADLDAVGRLDNTVVVVTADHGEAFFEHGHLDHNSTVYDEMLHVPLVLRVPPDIETARVDLDRLASLEDLTPTLLALAGVVPPDRVTGVDLLSDTPRNGILMRTSESQRIFGFRTKRWKVIAARGGLLAELFDLDADPSERKNVLLHFPEIVSSLAARWDLMEGRLPPRLDVVDVGVTEEETTMLRKLGYLN